MPEVSKMKFVIVKFQITTARCPFLFSLNHKAEEFAHCHWLQTFEFSSILDEFQKSVTLARPGNVLISAHCIWLLKVTFYLENSDFSYHWWLHTLLENWLKYLMEFRLLPKIKMIDRLTASFFVISLFPDRCNKNRTKFFKFLIVT